MDCKQSDNYFMKYMDGTLTEAEAYQLNQHLHCCGHCKEEFLVYDEMLSAFSELPVVAVPDGLEERVMAQILALEPVHEQVSNRIENIVWGIWSFLSVFLGLGFILTIYRTEWIQYLKGFEQLNGIVTMLEPVSNHVTQYITGLVYSVISGVSFTTDFITYFRLYFFVFIAVIIVGTQFFRTRMQNANHL